MEQELNRKLLTRDDFGKRRIHMCEQPLLRLDKEAQAKVGPVAASDGCATVNEIRQQYDRPAVEGGDIHLRQHQPGRAPGSPKLSGAQPTPPTEPNPERNETNSNSTLQHPRTHRGLHPEHPQGGLRLAGDGA